MQAIIATPSQHIEKNFKWFNIINIIVFKNMFLGAKIILDSKGANIKITKMMVQWPFINNINMISLPMGTLDEVNSMHNMIN